MPEPFRSGQTAIGLKALHAVPIFVEGQFWGMVAFDPTFRTLNWQTHSWGANGESLGRDNSQKYPLILGHNRIDLLGLVEN